MSDDDTGQSQIRPLAVGELAEGGYVDAPVFLDRNYVLLAPEIPVSKELVGLLRKWGYSSVYSSGTPQAKPASLEQGLGGAPIAQDLQELEHLTAAEAVYGKAMAVLDKVFTEFAESGELRRSAVSDQARDLCSAVRQNAQFMLRYQEFKKPPDNYLLPHSVNTAILSIVIAGVLKIPPHQQIELATAGLLHDVGMLKIPEAVYKHPGKIPPEQRKAMMAHTVLGYRILKGASLPEGCALAALEHHEHLDGSGYPQKLKGDGIHLYAKIVAVGASYNAITSNRPFKEADSAHQAVMELLKARKVRYDERIVTSLVYAVSLYPIGSPVELSDGTRGIVYESDPKDFKSPLVRLVRDREGRPVAEPTVVRTGEQRLTIVRGLTHAELGA